jgi:hypothetical protein
MLIEVTATTCSPANQRFVHFPQPTIHRPPNRRSALPSVGRERRERESPTNDLTHRSLLQLSATFRARLERYAPFVAAALALAAGLYVVDTLPVGGFYDDAFYVILAKSLATGHGYRNLNLPGAPFATHYPPGYPLFLAALWKIGPAFPANLVWFKAANAVFLSIAAGVACLFARERLGLGAGVALVATIAGTVTTPALYLSCMILSECMFLALIVPVLLWAEGATGQSRNNVGAAMALGGCAGALFLVRSQAIAVIGAITLAYALRRNWKSAALSLITSVIVIAPWLLWVRAHDSSVPALMRGDYGSYFAWFEDGLHERGFGLVTATLGRNVPDMFQHVVHRLKPIGSPILDVVASCCAAVLGIFGLVRIARKARVTFFFLLTYLGIVALWPFPPVRFLLGIWVLLMLVLAAGAQSIWELRLSNSASRTPWVTTRVAAAAASIVLVIGMLAYNVRGYQRHFWRNNEELSARWIAPKLAWARANTDTSAIIGTDHDEGSVYLYTGRRAVPITTFTASEYLSPRSAQEDGAVLTALATHFGARLLLLSSPRLRDAAVALGGKGVPLGDGTHQLVPWAYMLPDLARRATDDSLTLRASR